MLCTVRDVEPVSSNIFKGFSLLLLWWTIQRTDFTIFSTGYAICVTRHVLNVLANKLVQGRVPSLQVVALLSSPHFV